jgi:glycopeptide antibiotics resistance protein
MVGTAWTAFVIYGSLVPLEYHPMPLAEAVARFRAMQLPHVGLSMGVDWATNVLLFVPWSFFWMGALTADRSRRTQTLTALALLPLAFGLSVGVEFAQTWFRRTPSSYDIAAETLGAVGGAALYLAVGDRTIWWFRQYSSRREKRSQVEWLLLTYGIGLAIYALMPLDLTLNPLDLYHKYRAGQVLVVPFAYRYQDAAAQLYQSFADIVQFVPVGAWIVLTQRRRWPAWSPLTLGAAGTALVAAAIEFGQLLVLSRFTDVTDILLGAAGGAVGGWLAGRHDARAAAGRAAEGVYRGPRVPLWLAGIAGYSAFLALGFWFPFDLTADRHLIAARTATFFRTPFEALYLGPEFNALTQMLVRVLLFAPLGMLWGRVARFGTSIGAQRGIALFGIAYGIVLAFGIEAAEILMPSKVADFTEVLLCAIGLVGGFAIAWSLTVAGPREDQPLATTAGRDA